MYKYFIGIDPGKSGGISLISNDGELIYKAPFDQTTKEYDPNILFGIFTQINSIVGIGPVMAVIEKVSAMPGQGVSSMFKFGTMYGFIRMAVVAMGWSYELIAPRTWTKELHKGVDQNTQPKERSIIISSRLFPEQDFRKSQRSSTPHTGMVDATLLAYYGYLKHRG